MRRIGHTRAAWSHTAAIKRQAGVVADEDRLSTYLHTCLLTPTYLLTQAGVVADEEGLSFQKGRGTRASLRATVSARAPLRAPVRAPFRPQDGWIWGALPPMRDGVRDTNPGVSPPECPARLSGSHGWQVRETDPSAFGLGER